MVVHASWPKDDGQEVQGTKEAFISACILRTPHHSTPQGQATRAARCKMRGPQSQLYWVHPMEATRSAQDYVRPITMCAGSRSPQKVVSHVDRPKLLDSALQPPVNTTAIVYRLWTRNSELRASSFTTMEGHLGSVPTASQFGLEALWQSVGSAEEWHAPSFT